MSTKKPKYKKAPLSRRQLISDKSRDGWCAFDFNSISSELVKDYLREVGVVSELNRSDRHRIWKEMKYYFLKQSIKLQQYYGSSGLVEDLFQDSYIVFNDLLDSYIPVRRWTDDSSVSKLTKISDAYRVEHYNVVTGEINYIKYSGLKQFVNATMPLKLLDIVQRKYMKFYKKSESSEDFSCDLSSSNSTKSQGVMSLLNETSTKIKVRAERMVPLSNIVKGFLITKISRNSINLSSEEILIINYFFIDGFQEEFIAEMINLEKKLVRKVVRKFRSHLQKDHQYKKLVNYYHKIKNDDEVLE